MIANIFVRLYKQYIKPHVEFVIPVWTPCTQGDKEHMELSLQTLETRRRRYALIQTFKILKGFDCVDSSIWFKTVGNEPSRQTRQSAHHLNLVWRSTRTDSRSNFFSNRVVEPWNRLPTELKESRTVKSFKDGLDYII